VVLWHWKILASGARTLILRLSGSPAGDDARRCSDSVRQPKVQRLVNEHELVSHSVFDGHFPSDWEQRVGINPQGLSGLARRVGQGGTVASGMRRNVERRRQRAQHAAIARPPSNVAGDWNAARENVENGSADAVRYPLEIQSGCGGSRCPRVRRRSVLVCDNEFANRGGSIASLFGKARMVHHINEVVVPPRLASLNGHPSPRHATCPSDTRR